MLQFSKKQIFNSFLQGFQHVLRLAFFLDIAGSISIRFYAEVRLARPHFFFGLRVLQLISKSFPEGRGLLFAVLFLMKLALRRCNLVVRFKPIPYVVLHISDIAIALGLFFLEEDSFGAESQEVIVGELLRGLEMVAALFEKDSEIAGLCSFDRQARRFSIIHFLFIYLECRQALTFQQTAAEDTPNNKRTFEKALEAYVQQSRGIRGNQCCSGGINFLIVRCACGQFSLVSCFKQAESQDQGTRNIISSKDNIGSSSRGIVDLH